MVRFDMDLLPFKATFSNGRTKCALQEYCISGSLISEPWPLSHVLVKGITDSMSFVHELTCRCSIKDSFKYISEDIFFRSILNVL